MNTVHRHAGSIAAAVALSAVVLPITASSAENGRFEKLSVYLERNVQDHDAEIRFEVSGAKDGLNALKVLGPGERTVLDIRTPDSKLGIRQSTTESPEPDDDRVVRADFPAGTYRFEGKTTNGANLRDEARLSHVFPEPAEFEYPRSGQKDVPHSALTLRWSVPTGIESCVIVIEQNGSPYELRALVPASTRTFTIPKGFLRAGQAYTLAIGTVAKDGNRSFIETSFTTARER
jgi:predicted secreted protein